MRRRSSALTVQRASVCINPVSRFAFLLIISVSVSATSCTTLVNRRDLYSPEPAPNSLQAARQWYGIRSTNTTTTPMQRKAAEIDSMPDFRY
jgi:hypothetical protein